MEYGLIGERLPHSFSKEIHEQLAGYDYVLHEVARDEFDSFMSDRDFKGINVTIPYKKDVIPYLSKISDRAKACNAVNTVINNNGELYGTNTDFGGMLAMTARAGIRLKGAKVLILGSGGTSNTAHAVASFEGASEILKVSRDPQKGISYVDAVKYHSDADVIINTTPVGMYPDIFKMPVDLSPFTCLKGVADVIYNPLNTKLILDAHERKIPASGGLYMLIEQAVLASELFSGNKYKEETTEKIYKNILRSKMNIVLTGMPHSGKTTLGKIISEKTGRTLIDTDEMIIKKTSKTPSEIFAEKGEGYFRDLETDAVKEASVLNNAVISTGGGAVLRKENIDALKMNGTIFFLDRNINDLVPTDDRPTADSKEKIKELYNKRLPVYLSGCDVRIEINGSPESAASAILNEFEKTLLSRR